MSFNVVLKYNSSDKDHVTKTTQNKYTLTGSLKNQTSIVDPVIIIEHSGALTDVNYMYIAQFNRYYYITDIISVRTGLWEIHAHVDVLMSFKTEILANTAVIRRQENKWNLYLDDGIFKTYQNPDIITKEFPYGFSTHELVLAIAGA